MNLQTLEKSLYNLITETSTNLPKDVRRAIKKAKEAENAGTRAAMSLDTISNNIAMAEDECITNLSRHGFTNIQNLHSCWRKPIRN